MTSLFPSCGENICTLKQGFTIDNFYSGEWPMLKMSTCQRLCFWHKIIFMFDDKKFLVGTGWGWFFQRSKSDLTKKNRAVPVSIANNVSSDGNQGLFGPLGPFSPPRPSSNLLVFFLANLRIVIFLIWHHTCCHDEFWT